MRLSVINCGSCLFLLFFYFDYVLCGKHLRVLFAFTKRWIFWLSHVWQAVHWHRYCGKKTSITFFFFFCSRFSLPFSRNGKPIDFIHLKKRKINNYDSVSSNHFFHNSLWYVFWFECSSFLLLIALLLFVLVSLSSSSMSM